LIARAHASDPTDELLTIIGVFTHFFGIETTLEEREFFKKLAVLIGTRAARLSACGIAAIVSKKGYLDEGCAVGADGSLYNVSVGQNLCGIQLLGYRYPRAWKKCDTRRRLSERCKLRAGRWIQPG